MTTSEKETLAKINETEYMGFKVGELRKVFNDFVNYDPSTGEMVDNWKYPFHAWIPENEFGKYEASAIFIAGSPLDVLGTAGKLVHVFGAGYYEMIGA